MIRNVVRRPLCAARVAARTVALGVAFNAALGIAALALPFASTLRAQAAGSAVTSPDAKAQAVREWREQHEVEIVRELNTLLALPNRANDATGIKRNADIIRTMLARRGLSARLIANGPYPPAVYGELLTLGATRTVMFYAHYDGQPVSPEEWSSAPYKPTLRTAPNADGSPGAERVPPMTGQFDPEGRIYARSSSDDKAPIIAMLAAIDAIRATGQKPDANLKFFFEGEEEAGSAHLSNVLTQNKELLAADVWLICDGPAHQSRDLQIVFGVRGTMGLDATVYGPARALHSGHYGNWAPNPAIMMTELIASLRDTDGKILVDHFYDDVVPPTAADLAAARALPPVEAELRRSLLLGATEADNAALAERIMLPALNLHGIKVGEVGALSTNSVPTEARATFDFRLVADQRPERIRALVEAYLTARGWYVVHDTPTADERLEHARVVRLDWGGGYPAYRLSMDAPAGAALRRVVSGTIGKEVLVLPTLGGSVGLADIYSVVGVPLITFPTVNHDNSQHAKDENIRLQNIWDAIEVFAGVMTKFGTEWRQTVP